MSKNKQQATWGGRFDNKPSDLMLQIGESVSFDCRLALYDIECSRAHASMLEKVGILNESELKSILAGLDTVEKAIESQNFEWRSDLEDVHMNIEQALVEVSPEALKLHTARSRNDQVATDTKIWLREQNKLIDKYLQHYVLTIIFPIFLLFNLIIYFLIFR